MECVCEREREKKNRKRERARERERQRERERERERERINLKSYILFKRALKKIKNCLNTKEWAIVKFCLCFS